VKLGDSEETHLIQYTADEERARVLGVTLHYTKPGHGLVEIRQKLPFNGPVS
jgi:hypothetical protein